MLLWGVKLVSKGFNRACGTSLRHFITKYTKNRVTGLFSGALMAMALQSSTAVTLITSSFASKKIITVLAGIAVVLGADIGTTLAAQILIFDLSWLVPVLLSIGYIISRFKTIDGRYKHIGTALLGVGLVLLSLKLVVDASSPFRESETLQMLMTPLSDEPALALLLSAAITWFVHSSLAIVLLFASFVGSGIIPLDLGLILVLGANAGGAIIAYGDTINEKIRGRRIPLANVIMRFTGVILVLPFLDLILPYITLLSDDGARTIVNFHTAFNIGLAIVFLPFISQIEQMTKRFLPIKGNGRRSEIFSPKYLDYTAFDTPAAALSSAEREALRISDVVKEMLIDTFEVFRNDNQSLVHHISKSDNQVDALYAELKKYLAKITMESLSEKESGQNVQIMTFATNLEHIGDIIDNSTIELAQKKIKKQANFSDEGFSEIEEAFHIVLDSMRLAQHIFMNNDIKMAEELFHHKIKIKNLEKHSIEHHMRRLREKVSETQRTSSIHLDLFRDLRRIQGYLATVAYPTLEKAGKLHESRLKSVG